MASALRAAGVLAIPLFGFLGLLFSNGNWAVALLCVLPGLLFTVLLAGVAEALDRQHEILVRLKEQKDFLTGKLVEPVTCRACGESYAGDYTSCPYCGARPEQK